LGVEGVDDVEGATKWGGEAHDLKGLIATEWGREGARYPCKRARYPWARVPGAPCHPEAADM